MKKRKISFQKIFNLISAIFLITCCLFYGGRFIKLYLENKKVVVNEANTLGKSLKENSESFLKNVNGVYYFTSDVENNYVSYSGILFRAVKIEDNNIITLIANNSITSLALGDKKGYIDSYINMWLNKSEAEYSGILETKLNSTVTYLKKQDICLSKITEISDYSCSDYNSDYYLSSLTIEDYINTGAQNSFINTNENFYLSNIDESDNVWIVNTDGKITTSNNDNIYGVKPVIKLKENLNLISGNGTKDDPYVIESTLGLLGSYVELDSDIWRVIDFDENNVKLMLDDYLKDGSDTVSYKYSTNSSYHDDTKYNTLAYYLKNTFLANLSYKDKVLEVNYANGYYGSENNYNYTQTLKKTVNTKVAQVSIGDIILNHNLNHYFTMTSSSTKNNFVYTIESDATPYSRIVSSTNHVVPVITISRSSLEGTGSKSDPLRLGEV